MGTSSATVPPGARNFTGITPGSLTTLQPRALISRVARSMSSTSIAKWWMQGPSPAAFDSADCVPWSYFISVKSIWPSVMWRDRWSRVLRVSASWKPNTCR